MIKNILISFFIFLAITVLGVLLPDELQAQTCQETSGVVCGTNNCVEFCGLECCLWQCQGPTYDGGCNAGCSNNCAELNPPNGCQITGQCTYIPPPDPPPDPPPPPSPPGSCNSAMCGTACDDPSDCSGDGHVWTCNEGHCGGECCGGGGGFSCRQQCYDDGYPCDGINGWQCWDEESVPGGCPNGNRCCWKNSCTSPPPPINVDPANLWGQVYCGLPGYVENLQSTRTYTIHSGGDLMGETASDSNPYANDNYFLDNVVPPDTGYYFAVRAGGASGWAGATDNLYWSASTKPASCNPTNTHSYEGCWFGDVEGKTVSGFDFYTNEQANPTGNTCTNISGNKWFRPFWDDHPSANKYILRVFDNSGASPRLVHYRWYWTDGGTYHADCDGSECWTDIVNDFCYFNSATSSDVCEPIQELKNYFWDVRLITENGTGYNAQHCRSFTQDFTCSSSCSIGQPVPTAAPPACSDDPTGVTVNWPQISNASGYWVRVNGSSWSWVGSPAHSYTAISNPEPANNIVEVKAQGTSCQSSIGSTTYTFPTCNTQAWFQAQGGSIISSGVGFGFDGDFKSSVPDGSVLVSDAANGSVGALTYAGNLISPTTPSKISSTRWNANSDINFNVGEYNYDYFENKVPAIVTGNSGYETVANSVDTAHLRGDFVSSGDGVDYGGYIWHKYSPNNAEDTLTINNDTLRFLGDNKVILFVDGNVRLSTALIYNDPGFFLLIANGDIMVDPNLPPATDTIEGFYFVDNFVTETGGFDNDSQLTLTGAVSAIEGFDLSRSLSGNDTTPAERFVFAPQDVFKFPRYFSKKNLIWREVAP